MKYNFKQTSVSICGMNSFSVVVTWKNLVSDSKFSFRTSPLLAGKQRLSDQTEISFENTVSS